MTKKNHLTTEIEAKFLRVDLDGIRGKLRMLGATCEQPMRFMRRAIIETPELAKVDAFVRIRDEGDKVTLTYKRFNEASLTGAQEIEIVVSSFEQTVALFDHIGLTHKSLQESRRETWQMGDVEVVIDEWPWLSTYIEIEGFNEDHVKEAAAQLGFAWKDAFFGSVTTAYQEQYPDGDASQLVNVPVVAFDLPVPSVISGRSNNE